MRARLSIGVVACVLGLASSALGGPRPASHAESQPYVVPTGVTTSHEDSYPTGPTKDLAQHLEFHPAPGDRYVSFAAEDLTGRPVILEISQEAGPGGRALQGYMCQTVMPAAYELVSESTVVVRVLHGLCGNHNWGWATQGTVTATFSTANPGHLAHTQRRHHH